MAPEPLLVTLRKLLISKQRCSPDDHFIEMSKRKAESSNLETRTRKHGCSTTNEQQITLNERDTIDPCQSKLDHDKNTRESSSYSAAIEQIKLITSDINNIIKKHVMLLDARAAAYGIVGDFTNGMLDAEQMIQYAPTLAEGYIRMGELLSSLGYYRRAMNVYEQGIVKVDNEQQYLLQQCHDTAKLKSEARVDIIGRVPHDIVSSIIKHLEPYERIKLLGVSRMWQWQLSACSSLWSTISIDDYCGLTPANISHLPQIGDYILNLSFVEIDDDSLAESVLLEMTNGTFTRLSSLMITKCFHKDNRVLADALSGVSRTLTRLHIDLKREFDTSFSVIAPYKSLLSTCRNLEDFKCRYSRQVSLTEENAGILETGYTSKLVRLSLVFGYIELAAVEDVLRSCPDLRHLDLEGCDHTVTEVVNHHCRKLLSFFLDTRRDHSRIISVPSFDQSVAGLRTFAAGVYNDPCDFLPIFTDHHATLESVSLTPLGMDDRWEAFVGAFGNLTSLCAMELFCNYGATSCIAAASLLRKSPGLERLHLGGYIGGNSLLDAIVNLPNLRELQFTNTESTSEDMQQLFQDLIAKGSELALQKVVLSNVDRDFPFDEILNDYLPSIPTLRNVVIRRCKCATEQAINGFCYKLQFHPSMEALTLKDLIHGVSNVTLEHLAAVKRLKHLGLYGLHKITSHGIQVFENSTVNLTVKYCHNVSKTQPVHIQ